MQPQPTKSILLPLSLTILVSAILFGGGGYYLGTMSIPQNTPTPTTSLSTTASPSAKVSTSPTSTVAASAVPANWKTYTNSEYGIALKTPPNWLTEATSNTDVLLTVELNEKAIPEGTDKPNDLSISIVPLNVLDRKKLNITSLKGYLDAYIKPEVGEFQNLKTATIATKSGYSAEAGPNQFGGGMYYFTTLGNGLVVQIWDFAQNQTTKDIISTLVITK